MCAFAQQAGAIPVYRTMRNGAFDDDDALAQPARRWTLNRHECILSLPGFRFGDGRVVMKVVRSFPKKKVVHKTYCLEQVSGDSCARGGAHGTLDEESVFDDRRRRVKNSMRS